MNKNHMPEVAKILGVEIGEEFEVFDWEHLNLGKFYLSEKGLFMNKERENQNMDNPNILNSILTEEYTINRLPKPPKLTEAERVILEELFKKYTKIIRIETTELWVYNHSKDWKELAALSHLFQFIGEYRKEYDIEELLKGE